MKTSRRLFIAAVTISLFAGCASRPVGVSKSAWQALSPEQQAEYHHREAQDQRKAKLEGTVISETGRMQDGQQN